MNVGTDHTPVPFVKKKPVPLISRVPSVGISSKRTQAPPTLELVAAAPAPASFSASGIPLSSLQPWRTDPSPPPLPPASPFLVRMSGIPSAPQGPLREGGRARQPGSPSPSQSEGAGVEI
uniref:Uncharacterized protein n=1 Tax=Sphaerodactylus townsendi TaxID=933632 RepID=A0ACB8FSY2_9SAUR